MPVFPKISVPPVTAECETTVSSAATAAAKPTPWKMFRSGDGKTRLDYGDTSVISNPAAQQGILLDHVKKEARLFPMPPPSPPQLKPARLPRAGAPPPFPSAPPVNGQDLGKRIIEGHEAEGKRYLFQPPRVPTIPEAPQPPAPPPAPGLPQAPKLTALPQAQLPPQPSPPRTVEVWTSTKLHLPLLTRITHGAGEQINRCKKAIPGEPSAALFQIPPGYNKVEPPKLPA